MTKKPNKIIIIFSILLSVTSLCTAQSYNLADTATVLKLIKESADSGTTNARKSVQLAEQAIKIAQKINYTRGYVKALSAKAIRQATLGQPGEAIQLLLLAQKTADDNGIKELLPDIHLQLGSAYDDKGDYKQASRQYDISLKLIPPTDSINLSTLYCNMAVMMHHVEDFEGSILYMKKGLAILPSQEAHMKEASIANNLAAAYIVLKDYKTAYQYLYRSIFISDSLHSKKDLPLAYMNLALCHDITNKKDSAVYYYLKSLELFKAQKDIRNEAILLNDIGSVYFDMHKLDEAASYFKKSLAMALQSSNLFVTATNYNNLSRLYYEKGDYKTSCNYKDLYCQCRDTLYANESLQALADLTTKYETKEVEHSNALLHKENDLQKLRLRDKNIMVYSLLGAAVLTIIIGFLLVRQNRLKNAKQKMELEQKQLLAQINPHFIFNCLNSIQQFVVQNDTLNANRYLADFALLMRQTLDNSKDGIISLTREMEYLNNYLSFEHMRFEDKFSYTIICTPDIDPDTVEIPSMIIQPFVENAVRHGLCNLEDRLGILEITFYKENGFLHCKVDDNGIGMEESKKQKEQMFLKYQSLGMELTRQRLALVSKLHSEAYKISIINKTNQNQSTAGTTIIIKFPFQA